MSNIDILRRQNTQKLIERINNLGGFQNISQVQLAKYCNRTRSAVSLAFLQLQRGKYLWQSTIDNLNQALDLYEKEIINGVLN